MQENKVGISDDIKCYWYKSQSITKENKRYYTACHELCNGKTAGCDKYISKNCLINKLLKEELS